MVKELDSRNAKSGFGSSLSSLKSPGILQPVSSKLSGKRLTEPLDSLNIGSGIAEGYPFKQLEDLKLKSGPRVFEYKGQGSSGKEETIILR